MWETQSMSPPPFLPTSPSFQLSSSSFFLPPPPSNTSPLNHHHPSSSRFAADHSFSSFLGQLSSQNGFCSPPQTANDDRPERTESVWQSVSDQQPFTLIHFDSKFEPFTGGSSSSVTLEDLFGPEHCFTRCTFQNSSSLGPFQTLMKVSNQIKPVWCRAFVNSFSSSSSPLSPTSIHGFSLNQTPTIDNTDSTAIVISTMNGSSTFVQMNTSKSGSNQNNDRLVFRLIIDYFPTEQPQPPTINQGSSSASSSLSVPLPFQTLPPLSELLWFPDLSASNSPLFSPSPPTISNPSSTSLSPSSATPSPPQSSSPNFKPSSPTQGEGYCSPDQKLATSDPKIQSMQPCGNNPTTNQNTNQQNEVNQEIGVQSNETDRNKNYTQQNTVKDSTQNNNNNGNNTKKKSDRMISGRNNQSAQNSDKVVDTDHHHRHLNRISSNRNQKSSQNNTIPDQIISSDYSISRHEKDDRHGNEQSEFHDNHNHYYYPSTLKKNIISSDQIISSDCSFSSPLPSSSSHPNGTGSQGLNDHQRFYDSLKNHHHSNSHHHVHHGQQQPKNQAINNVNSNHKKGGKRNSGHNCNRDNGSSQTQKSNNEEKNDRNNSHQRIMLKSNSDLYYQHHQKNNPHPNRNQYNHQSSDPLNTSESQSDPMIMTPLLSLSSSSSSSLSPRSSSSSLSPRSSSSLSPRSSSSSLSPRSSSGSSPPRSALSPSSPASSGSFTSLSWNSSRMSSPSVSPSPPPSMTIFPTSQPMLVPVSGLQTPGNPDLNKARKRNTGIVVFQWVNESERKKNGKRRRKYDHNNLTNGCPNNPDNKQPTSIIVDDEIDDVEEIEEVVMKDSDSPSGSPSPSASSPPHPTSFLAPPNLSPTSPLPSSLLSSSSSYSLPSRNSIQMLLN